MRKAGTWEVGEEGFRRGVGFRVEVAGLSTHIVWDVFQDDASQASPDPFWGELPTPCIAACFGRSGFRV